MQKLQKLRQNNKILYSLRNLLGSVWFFIILLVIVIVYIHKIIIAVFCCCAYHISMLIMKCRGIFILLFEGTNRERRELKII